MLNLDTHIVVHFLNGSLTPEEYRSIVEGEPAISEIVLWELAKLVQQSRISIDLGSYEFVSFLGRVRIIPISLKIARQSTRLDISSDPADEIIAATSIVEQIPLLTRDRTILQSQLVPFAL